MAESKFGPKIRALRRRHGLRQVDLAQRLGISASYLNLIEHDQRTLTAPLLLKLAELYPLDLKSFAPEDHARLISDLHEVFGDTLFETHDVTTTDLLGNPASPILLDGGAYPDAGNSGYDQRQMQLGAKFVF